MTAEEQIRRTRICLAEIGLEDIDIQQIGTRDDGIPIIGTSAAIPPAIGWQVAHLLSQKEGVAMCCWSCYIAEALGTPGRAAECRAGQCREPNGPQQPPREQLIGRYTPIEAIDMRDVHA